jgi:CubicO group peptidase (beta-lactamase class C family)
MFFMIDDGRFPFVHTVVSRREQIVHHDLYGFADRDSQRPYREGCISRVYSMTKPVTSVALMMLYERGLLLLEHPVSRYLPAFAEPRVFTSGDDARYETREAAREMTVQDVLTHTSGLTYGFQHQHAVDAIYRRHGLGDFTPSTRSLAEEMALLGSLPLQFDPGTRCAAPSSRWSAGCRWTSSSPPRSSSRSGWSTPRSGSRATTAATASPPTTSSSVAPRR